MKTAYEAALSRMILVETPTDDKVSSIRAGINRAQQRAREALSRPGVADKFDAMRASVDNEVSASADKFVAELNERRSGVKPLIGAAVGSTVTGAGVGAATAAIINALDITGTTALVTAGAAIVVGTVGGGIVGLKVAEKAQNRTVKF